MKRPFRLGPVTTFTANRTRAMDVLGVPLFLKSMPDFGEARAEIRGRRVLSGRYPLPRLYGSFRTPRRRTLIYERWGAGDHEQGLFLDLLNAADSGSGGLDEYLETLTHAYRTAIADTARPLPPTQSVRKLYWDRALPGGRLDQYYAGREFSLADGIADVPISRLRDYELVVNGASYHLDWAETLSLLRLWATDETSIWSAVTQGDPTDVNLAVPFAVFDYDTAGFNAVAGEFANFLWYTAHLGGYLVPTYNPTVFAGHVRTFEHVDANAPALRSARVDEHDKQIVVEIDWKPSLARRQAISTYLDQVVKPLQAPMFGPSLDAQIRPFLALRILGVYNVADLRPVDRLAVLVRLAQCLDSGFSLGSFFSWDQP